MNNPTHKYNNFEERLRYAPEDKKYKGKICVEKDGIKVGDKVKYRSGDKEYTGYVAVIDPKDDEESFLLRLKDYIEENYNGFNYWGEDWYPEEEKKGENCWWACKKEIEIILLKKNKKSS